MKNNINFIVRITSENINAKIISLYLINDDGYSFYAEFNDFDINDCNNYTIKSIINNMRFNDLQEYINEEDKYNKIYKDNSQNISLKLNKWLEQFDDINFIGNKENYGWYHFLKLISI